MSAETTTDTGLRQHGPASERTIRLALVAYPVTDQDTCVRWTRDRESAGHQFVDGTAAARFWLGECGRRSAAPRHGRGSLAHGFQAAECVADCNNGACLAGRVHARCDPGCSPLGGAGGLAVDVPAVVTAVTPVRKDVAPPPGQTWDGTVDDVVRRLTFGAEGARSNSTVYARALGAIAALTTGGGTAEARMERVARIINALDVIEGEHNAGQLRRTSTTYGPTR